MYEIEISDFGLEYEGTRKDGPSSSINYSQNSFNNSGGGI